MSFDWLKILKPIGNPPTPQDIIEFEEIVGLDLPDDYRNFLMAFNGGEIMIEHDIRVPGIPFDLGVWYFWPLSAPSPFLGIREARRMQAEERMCLRQAIAVGGDGGTGHYYLLLTGEKRGAVFFIWLDDRPQLPCDEWETWDVRIPEEMVEVAPDFDSLGELVLTSARRRPKGEDV